MYAHTRKHAHKMSQMHNETWMLLIKTARNELEIFRRWYFYSKLQAWFKKKKKKMCRSYSKSRNDIQKHNLLCKPANLRQQRSNVTVICTQASRPHNTSRKLAMWTRYASQAASSLTPCIPGEFRMLPAVTECSVSRACNVRRSPWNQTSNRSQIGQRSLLIALGRECQLNYFSRSWKWFLANLLDTYLCESCTESHKSISRESTRAFGSSDTAAVI